MTNLILILLAPLILLSSCTISSNDVQNSNNQSLYKRVMQSGKIRCGYVLYTPGCMKDPNTGKFSGIGIDILEIIANKLGLKLEMVEEVGLETMLEGLRTKRYDMIATPTWANASRAKLVDFSMPLFYSPVCAYIKNGNHKLKDNLAAVNSSKIVIACMDGGTARLIAESDFPKAKLYTLPQNSDFSQVLLTVATGKADVTFVEPALAYAFLQHNPESIEKINSVVPMRLFPNCYVFDRGEDEFKSMFNTVLDETLNSGQIEKTIDKYEPTPNLVYKVALPYQRAK